MGLNEVDVSKVRVGAKIRILYMEGLPIYKGKEGTIQKISDEGYLYGDWGMQFIIPEVDSFEYLG